MHVEKNASSEPATEVPSLSQWKASLRYDLVAGFLVFLIALPLCLGISVASGFPAINGVFTAIAGGIICGLFSNSELTIKGPAAGMIAIVLGCVLEFQQIDKDNALKFVAAVGVISGAIQILFAVVKAGKLADSFPSSVIHGLLASIGLIIIGKQLYPLLGLRGNRSEHGYEAYLLLPDHISQTAWQVALIGITSLAILFIYPILKKRINICKIVPAQLVVLLIGVPVAMYFFQPFADDKGALKRSYPLTHHEIELNEESANKITPDYGLLVKVPTTLDDLKKAVIYPDFSMLGAWVTWKWVIMFTLVGTLESLLSAKAVDTLDPWKRKSNLNRDLFAVGVANTAVSAIGGLPMISEIVRSSANKDYGARTRLSNIFHGIFLLISILTIPVLLNKIPVACLAAMLIYAGCRLANYKEFLHMLHIGKEQLLIFVATIAGVLATDLLIGVGIGIVTKFLVEIFNGVSIGDFFRMPVTVQPVNDQKVLVQLHSSALFSNWILLKGKLEKLSNYQQIVLDCTDAHLIDHTVMARLHEMERELASEQRSLSIVGLDTMRSLSHHPLATRVKISAITA